LSKRSHTTAAVGAAGVIVCLVAFAAPASAAGYEDAIGLGTAGAYSVLAGSTVTNTGPSVLSGALGVSPGTAITGFPPGVAGGATNAGNADSASAQSSLTTAYLEAEGRQATGTSLGLSLVGGTHQPGVYNASSSLGVSGAVTLDGQGNPNSVFIFQVGASMTTASSTSIVLIGNAQACNVFWQVGASATLGTNTTFAGTVMALTSVTLNTGTTVAGRALARNGAVTLDDNVLTSPSCVTTATTTTVSATPATSGGSTTVTATVAASGASTPTGTVSFTANGVPAGTAAIDSTGHATVTVPVGIATSIGLVAHYGGLRSYTASTSPVTTLTITPAAAPTSTTSTSSRAPTSPPAATTTSRAATEAGSATPTAVLIAARSGSSSAPSSTPLADTGPTQLTALGIGAAALMLGGAGLVWGGSRHRRPARHSARTQTIC
jgi:type VI secretion system secreted protein VgrG